MTLDVVRIAELLAPLVAELAKASTSPPAASIAEGPAFMTRGAFAERCSLAVRTVDKLIARGLPVVGRGRLLRVDVAAADEWLRLHLGDEPEDEGDDVERLARANAGARR